MGTKSILIRSFLEKNAIFRLLPIMTSQFKLYLKSISAGQKRAFFVKKTFLSFSVINSTFIIQSLSNNQNKVNKQRF